MPIALALAVLPQVVAAQVSNIQPQCTADRHGDRVITAVHYPNGYIAEAPWRVADFRAAQVGSQRILQVVAQLDRVIEVNPGSRERVATPFPSVVEIAFEVQSEQEILEAIAKVWCSTVTRVRANGTDVWKPQTAPAIKAG